MVLVSACLLGISCRYDGASKENEALMKLAQEGRVIPVCPEQLGGCPTPRNRCEIKDGTGAGVLAGKCIVESISGEDMTGQFIKGARETLKLAKICGANKAILKARSPSCGFGEIYDGTFSGKLRDGNGVTAELLHQNGIEIITEEAIEIKNPGE